MNWKKVGIVISHEYTTRVRKKSFILTTLLTPIGIAMLICVPALIMLFSGNENQKVKVIDESGIVAPYFENSEHTTYVMGTEGDGLAKETIADADYVVRIPMFHNVDSLNVAAAAAVAFWELRK